MCYFSVQVKIKMFLFPVDFSTGSSESSEEGFYYFFLWFFTILYSIVFVKQVISFMYFDRTVNLVWQNYINMFLLSYMRG